MVNDADTAVTNCDKMEQNADNFKSNEIDLDSSKSSRRKI